MTLEDQTKLTEEAIGLANLALGDFRAACEHWKKAGHQGRALACLDSARESAKRAAILLEQVAKE